MRLKPRHVYSVGDAVRIVKKKRQEDFDLNYNLDLRLGPNRLPQIYERSIFCLPIPFNSLQLYVFRNNEWESVII